MRYIAREYRELADANKKKRLGRTIQSNRISQLTNDIEKSIMLLNSTGLEARFSLLLSCNLRVVRLLPSIGSKIDGETLELLLFENRFQRLQTLRIQSMSRVGSVGMASLTLCKRIFGNSPLELIISNIIQKSKKSYRQNSGRIRNLPKILPS